MNMTAFTWFTRLHNGMSAVGFYSTERPCQRVSNSEIRRWFAKGSIEINGKRMKADDEMEEVVSCVVHPKSKKKRITIF